MKTADHNVRESREALLAAVEDLLERVEALESDESPKAAKKAPPKKK
jgi:hypothetical protein